jgi:hypothetical protein
MSIVELALTEGPLAAAYLLAMGALAFGIVPVTPVRLRFARNCFLASCAIFAGIAILWGITTDYATWPRVLIVGALAALTGIGAVESSRFIMHEQNIKHDGHNGTNSEGKAALPERVEPPSPGPTFEATNNSTIDARKAKIPDDLSFRIARADDHSLIAMQGLEVTKTGDGWQLKPGNAEIQFPYPPMLYANMPTPVLRRKIEATANELREFQTRYTAELKLAISDTAKMKAISETYRSDYDKEFSELSFSLASAALNRIGAIPGISRPASSGGQIVYYKKFVGPTPASDAAAFLDFLSNKLPKH